MAAFKITTPLLVESIKCLKVVLVLIISATPLQSTLLESLSAGLGHERRPVKVLSVLWQHLEVYEVCELMPNHGAVDEDVVLLLHQLSERVYVQWAPNTGKQLRILQISCELVEGLG